ncbi:helix-turn-helix domain-containing protein [Streptomyces fulvoviolaceus]|uniref:helix-turn-helix domain-containing protein n=1 Tax=Streptomyces fulvoviolaceus TaxID=285535 RepID=UPI0021BF66FB|nr:helix-turn-helix domain-containing protein [Streptomyces fulvoviolaceus]MCT9080384.1 helix-turn-helix domain-containing protein [Streptomyces fulvoviolaceus]
MDIQNTSAPSRPQSRIAGKNHPHAGGLEHDHTRHATRFTVIGNHLAQHPSLSGLAIGLAVYIQSLPKGTRVDIKTLAARFPEGTTRIAAALRELETHGYLRRERKRTPGGRIVTRTISCNQPGHQRRAAEEHGPTRPKRQQEPRKKALPAVPQPSYPHPTLLQQATDLLAGLRRHDSRLLLSTCDTAHLAPGVAAWLEREVTSTAVRQALTTDLPDPLCRPAALLAHRLTAQLPPLLPYRAPAAPPPVQHPLQTCDGCERAFRAPAPGRCRDCRTDSAGNLPLSLGDCRAG